MNKAKMGNQSHGFLRLNSSFVEKMASYKLRSKLNKNLFFQALKYSDPKRKELFGDDQIQSEMDLLKNLMQNKRKPSYKLCWNKSLTIFERYEALKRENKEVFKRKAAINSRKDFSLPKIKKYFLQVKKLIIQPKASTTNSFECLKNSSSAPLTPLNQPLKRTSANQMMLRGTKIGLKKSSNLEQFLETRASSFNMTAKNKTKLQFYSTVK